MPPQNLESSGHRNFYVGLSTVTLFLGVFFGWAVWGGGWSALREKVSFVEQTSPEPSVSAHGEQVNWKSLLPLHPLKTTTAESDYETSTYGVYEIGVIATGTYAGKSVVLAAKVDENLVTLQPNYGGYAYFISDKTGAPVGRWKNSIAYAGWSNLLVNIHLIDEDGVTTAPLLPADRFPAELIPIDATSTVLSNGSLVRIDPRVLTVPPLFTKYPILATTTFGGDPLVQIPFIETGVKAPNYTYGIQLPFGAIVDAYLEADFMNNESIPQLTWTKGSTAVASYNYDGHAYGWQDCFESFADMRALVPALGITGTTVHGDSLYELNISDARASDTYHCLYEKTQRYNWDADTQTSTSYYPATYAEFIQSHPLFFWKHPLGDWIAFIRSDVVPAAEKAKPVIYLYPTKTEKVRVEVSPVGGFTKTIPDYGSGWSVEATPQGLLTNSDGKTYPYLFWEGGKEGVVATPKEGFVVSKHEVAATLDEKLSLLGLDTQERADFLEFWVPKLSAAPYYFITFIPRQEIDRVAPLSVTPAPDTVIRVLMDYESLQTPKTVEPLPLLNTPRSGFTVVEWGGIVH